ncbi:hypothetical protein HSE3_gp009 [Bacillus phage vB_BceM-HSE3]|nr:hypothetical protein HSE3_gp009 [Bacillus phage vB_BceM-HSE3]
MIRKHEQLVESNLVEATRPQDVDLTKLSDKELQEHYDYSKFTIKNVGKIIGTDACAELSAYMILITQELKKRGIKVKA